MRICSLVPGATEIVAALGLTDHLVGISHECDFPPAVRQAAVMVEPAVGAGVSSSADIDQQVKALVSSGQRLYRLNEQAFLDARPDLILIQDLCQVCAVTRDQLDRVLPSLAAQPQLVALNPSSLCDVINDVERIGEALGQVSKARELAHSLRQRIATVRSRAAARRARPRVLCLEWLSPPYVGGHWIPEMVHLAGGEDLFGLMSRPSREVTWSEIAATQPDIVILMSCGFSVARTLTELTSLCHIPDTWSHALRSWPKTYAVDAASYFSRPGPRLIDGLELLADIFSGTVSTRFDKSVVQEITGTPLPVSPIS
jgi:iron complex transport system substrate-binding protein